DHGYRTHGEALQKAARSLLLNGSENDFKFHSDIPDRPQKNICGPELSVTKWEYRTQKRVRTTESRHSCVKSDRRIFKDVPPFSKYGEGNFISVSWPTPKLQCVFD